MSKEKRAFITGITGQDGSYLAEFLLKKGYAVAGLARRNVGNDLGNIKHLKGDVKLYYGDIQSPETIALAFLDYKPHEIYNLAAQSSPLASFSNKVGTLAVTGIGAVNVFERARVIVPEAKIYQASTSELYGAPKQVPQNEETPITPANPYAAAKAYAHWMASISRRDRNQPQFISCGILFNHESPRRGLNFVTRKVTAGVACIKNKKKDNVPLNEIGEPIVQNGKLKLGYLGSKRDWGFSGDYVEAMWLMLQHKVADDFIIATGEVHTVEELCKIAFGVVGLDYKDYVETDPSFIPPVETGPLVGDYSKAKKVLGWKPNTSFEKMIELMVHSDLALFT